MKESELLLRPFAEKFLEVFSDDELKAFEMLLEHSDADILSWVMCQTTILSSHEASLLEKLRNFKENDSTIF